MNKKKILSFTINILFPCLLLSGLVGILSGVVVFFFKVGASYLIDYSHQFYEFVRANPIYIPLLYLGLVLMATLCFYIIRSCKCAKGGGIPTAVGILRGLITFKWLKNLIGTVLSAFSSYISGLSLGEEGQCVQIGTCIGKGVSKLAGKKEKAWDRYVMTGGASSGFAVATNAPISGVFFALEEAHKRFSPMIIMVALSSTVFAFATASLLGNLTGLSGHAMNISTLSIKTLSLENIWIPILVGLIIGLFASGVTEFFKLLNSFWSKLNKIPTYVKILIVFVLSGSIGLILPSSLGGGVTLINAVTTRGITLWLVAVLLIIKVFLSLFSNRAGVTGGLFIPTLCHGALIGAIIAELLILIGLDESYYLSIVVISMSSYLASVQRTPITALIFSLEVFNGLSNALYIAIAVFLAFMIIEIFNSNALNDIALDERLKQENKNRVRVFVEADLVVQKNSFAIGKMVRDVFWPSHLHVVSVFYNNEAKSTKDGDKHIHEGDILRVVYQKYSDNEDESDQILKAIVGDQEIVNLKNNKEKVPV